MEWWKQHHDYCKVKPLSLSTLLIMCIMEQIWNTSTNMNMYKCNTWPVQGQFEDSNGCVRGVSVAAAIGVDRASATYAQHTTVGALKLGTASYHYTSFMKMGARIFTLMLCKFSFISRINAMKNVLIHLWMAENQRRNSSNAFAGSTYKRPILMFSWNLLNLSHILCMLWCVLQDTTK